MPTKKTFLTLVLPMLGGSRGRDSRRFAARAGDSPSQTVKDVTNVLKNLLQIQRVPPLSSLFETERIVAHEEGIPYEESFSQLMNNRPDYSQKKIALESKDIT